MAIKVIVELQAKPGQRAVLKSLLESVAATLGPGEPGFLGPDVFEIAIPDSHHHVMIDQPLALVSALRILLATWPGKRPA